MLRSEYEGITGTSVYPDIYRDLIEPMYLEAPPWMTKYDFCASINAKALSEVPAVPDCVYVIGKARFKCVKVDMTARTIKLEGLPDSRYYNEFFKMTFDEAKEWRKRKIMRDA